MRPDQYSGHEQPDDGRQAQTISTEQAALVATAKDTEP